MTVEQLQYIMPAARKAAVDIFLEQLNEYMPRYEINTPARICAFIAQIAHESGQFRYTREIWGPTAAQKRYEGRKDLGNVYQGDGKRYMGRGLIQITGRANYASCSVALTGTPDALINTPELLSTPAYATESACWFWKDRGLNELADTGDFQRITKRINGGLTGLKEREGYWERAKEVIQEEK